jgi:putative spermidine/putrescine transport system substrate-binding protein
MSSLVARGRDSRMRKASVAALLILAAACGDAGQQQEAAEGQGGEVVFVGWGGTTQEAMSAAWLEPFEAETGIEVIQDEPTDYAKLQTQVESANVQWDVVDVEPFFAISACEDGLLEPLDYSVIDRSNILEPHMATECGIQDFNNSNMIAYNTDAFSGGNHPTTWAEFFDLERFPGKRGLWDFASGGALEAALLADGVPGDQLYPLDVERALAKLDTIKDSIVWWATGTEQQELIRSGEVSATFAWDGRMFELAQQGAPVAVEWNENIGGVGDSLVVPKGAPNKEAAMQLIAFIVGKESQERFAETAPFAPINTLAEPDLEPLAAEFIATNPEIVAQRAASFDWAWWAENIDAVSERWNEWIQE